MDDRTVGLVLLALRRRRGWRQSDLAAAAGCSQPLVSMVERGHVSRVVLETLRSLFAAVDARLAVVPSWRGVELHRLLDAEHTRLVDSAARRLERAGWEPSLEVTYSIYGERGSVDILGIRPLERAVIVAEIKSDIATDEATARKLDEKRRLAPTIVRERFGWDPVVIGAVLVLPESPRLRRLLAGPATALSRSFPVASRAIATWLRRPDRALAATWFLSDITVRNARRMRVRRTAGASRPGREPAAPPIGAKHDGGPYPRILR